VSWRRMRMRAVQHDIDRSSTHHAACNAARSTLQAACSAVRYAE
jgi:hypothetical protein